MDRTLALLTSLGLGAVVLLCPLFMGGRHSVGILAVVVVATFLASVECLKLLRSVFTRKQTYNFAVGPLGWLGLLAIAIAALQLAPSGAMSALAPNSAELLSTWNSSGSSTSLGSWASASLNPASSRSSFALVVSYVVIGLVAFNHLSTRERISGFVKFLGVSMACFALLGICQYLFGNGKYLWLYSQPLRGGALGVQGPFTNPNHFAHFIALGIGPLVWMTFESWNRADGKASSSHRQTNWQPIIASVACIGVIVASGALSLSRGGMIVHGLAILISVALACYATKKLLPAVLAVGGSALVMMLLVSSNGYEHVQAELETMSVASSEELQDTLGREYAWNSALSTFENFPLLGVGAGVYRDAYKCFMDKDISSEFTHAESGYLQIMAETGVAGAALLAIALTWFGLVALGVLNSSSRAFGIAILPGLAISMVHSLADFVWYIPACLSVTILLLACMIRLHEHEKTQEELQPSRHGLVTKLMLLFSTPRVSLAVGLLLIFCIPFAIRDSIADARANQHWEAYLERTALKDIVSDSNALTERIERLDEAIEHLSRCVEVQPAHSRAHLRLAETYLHKFELLQSADGPDALGIAAFDEAARLSEYGSAAEVEEWLQRALGERRTLLYHSLSHAFRGVHACPLQGQGYVILAQLSFLVPGRLDASELLDQAARVRPADAELLFVAGVMHHQQGRIEEGDLLLKKASKLSSKVRDRVIQAVAGWIPPSDFIERFAPDRTGLVALINFYQRIQAAQPSLEAADVYFALVEEDAKGLRRAERGDLMKEAAKVSSQLGLTESAWQFNQQALECNPNDFSIRHSVALMMLERGDHKNAEAHLRWCAARRPGDKKIAAELRQAISIRR